MRLALLKGDFDALEHLVGELENVLGRKHSYWFNVSSVAMRLDAFVALGDRARVEEEAESLLELRKTYIEPFALRALGQVRGQPELVRRALERFEEMRLDWHAEQTRALLAS